MRKISEEERARGWERRMNDRLAVLGMRMPHLFASSRKRYRDTFSCSVKESPMGQWSAFLPQGKARRKGSQSEVSAQFESILSLERRASQISILSRQTRKPPLLGRNTLNAKPLGKSACTNRFETAADDKGRKHSEDLNQKLALAPKKSLTTLHKKTCPFLNGRNTTCGEAKWC